MPGIDPRSRFSGRVADYARYRPSYPAALVDELAARCSLDGKSRIADLGSGTGLLAEVFVRRGFAVVGVEPNREVRLAGDTHLGQYAAFTSSTGAAEATGLDPASTDLVTAGQAFHWFDVEASRAECQRILKAGCQGPSFGTSGIGIPLCCASTRHCWTATASAMAAISNSM